MSSPTVEIPIAVLSSVENLDELLDWLTANSPEVIQELREARQEDLAGKFVRWTPRFVECDTPSK
jgi:hypothetical protein